MIDSINDFLIKDLNKEYQDIAFVTMCFNIKDSKENDINLSLDGGDRHLKREYVDFYVKSVEKLCAKFKDIVVFCDKECADNLYAPNAKVIVMKLEELPLYNKLYTLQQLFQNTAERVRYTKNINLHKKASAHQYLDRALYAVLVLSKWYFMARAAELKYVKQKYLCWLDAGMGNKSKMHWEGWNGQISMYPKKGKVRCLVSKGDNINQTIQDLNNTSLNDAIYIRRPRTLSKRYLLSLIGREVGPVPQNCAISFMMHAEDSIIFSNRFDEYLIRIINMGLICFEQGIITIMIKEHPDWFEVVFSYGEDLQYLFNGDSIDLQ